MLPFWISIALLSLAQGALVGVPSRWRIEWPRRLRSGAWAAVPALSVVGFVAVARVAEAQSAQALTYLALVAVPLLAAGALGGLVHGARSLLALAVIPLFALAWADRGGLAGGAAALTLSALSCVALAVALAAVTPARWLALGILAMAAADAALVAADLLQQPNDALNAAHPAAGLPQLQAVALGSAAMGYGDLFVAALLGALLALSGARAARRQRYAALLVAAFALGFDLLFFAVDELPATVPVALATLLMGLARREPEPRRGAGAAVEIE